jgi:23S rRNA pseudouridine1911/1915/1917 synthase
VERPGIVHRLDKDTSGCIVVAKNDRAHLSLTTQFAERDTGKIYLAVVQGCPKEPEGTVFTNIGRHPVNRLKMAVVNPGAGKPAITDYRVLHHDVSTNSSLVMCTLHTGRTHQIRVHMLHLGHPLIGDPIYAHPQKQKAKPGRLMLHAWRLAFNHPADGRRVAIQSPIPPEYTPWLLGAALPEWEETATIQP